MSTATLYVPKKNEKFVGYISTIQDNIEANVKLSSSEIYNDQHQVINAFNWTSHYPFASLEPLGWFTFSFNEKPFFITHYELRQRHDYSNSYIREWAFEGSNDNISWRILDKEFNVPGFAALNESRLFEIKRKGSFKYFRLRSLYKDGILTVKAIEVYGFFCENEVICDPPYSYQKTIRCRSRNIPVLSYSLMIIMSTYS